MCSEDSRNPDPAPAPAISPSPLTGRSHRRPVNRLILLAQPGEGKTSLLREIVRRYRPGGGILDPMGDFREAGIRWDRWEVPRLSYINPKTASDWLGLLDQGAALIGDEYGRFVPRAASPENPFLQWMDSARNKRCKFAVAEKKATRLDSLLVDCATHVAFRPFRSVAARKWIEDAAEVDVESLPELPLVHVAGPSSPLSLENPWYVLEIGQPIERWSALEIVQGFGDTSALSA